MTNFKSCNVCDFIWKDRDSFLSDPNTEIIGYQVSYDEEHNGFFMFNHNCGTSLSIPVDMFGDLYHGPKYKNILLNTEQCPEYCLDENDLNPCGEDCKFSFARELIQLIKKWQKYKN